MILKIYRTILSLGLFFSSNYLLAAPSPADDIEIENIIYNGSGCPFGTVAENVSPDKQAFTITFSDFIAEAGPGLPLSSGRRNCQLTIDLTIPQGWQFSISSFDYRGFAFLDLGVHARYTTNYYFQAESGSTPFSRNLYGEFDDLFQFRENFPIETVVWSPCGITRALNVNTSVFVRNTNSSSYPYAQGIIGTDSIDGQVTQVWGITWRQCNN